MWEEKNPVVAGVLAYLIPGAGHLYQGRILKGVIYSVSILGLFLWGQKLGEGMVINNVPNRNGPLALRKVSLSFAAQLGAGAPALPALIQNWRADQPGNSEVTRLSGPLTSEFRGRLTMAEGNDDHLLAGTIHLEPFEGDLGPEVRGTFMGTLDGQQTKLELGGFFRMDKPIKAGFRRYLKCDVLDQNGNPGRTTRVVVGSIPRSVWNAYGAPPEPEQVQELYEHLGTAYDLALVFTWIAGLLNVLAIWDCVCGPAYGFGDEHATEGERTDTASGSTTPPPDRGGGSPANVPVEGKPVQKPPGAK